ncbi:hypothetical protein AeRB84_020648, partial [Aphanomyces euteiches]
ILRLQAYFRKEGIKNPSSHIAMLLGRGIKTVQSVWSEYCDQKELTIAQTPSNKSSHVTRIPRSKAVMTLVLEFILEHRLNRARVVAKDVLALLVEHKLMKVDMTNEKHRAAALRVTQLFLARCGFKRGTQKGVSYGISAELAVKRDRYIRYISTQLQLSTPRTIVYIDELYIHHHYSRHNNSIYHPDDTASVPKKAKNKGRRLYFIAAIMSGGESDPKLLGLEIFEGGNRQPKDYHAMFTSEFFLEWFADLLDEIDKLQKYGVIFAMDNAKYHRTKPPDTPRGSMKKSDLMAACKDYGLDFDGVPTKPVVWASLKDFISRNIPAEVEKWLQSEDMSLLGRHHIILISNLSNWFGLMSKVKSGDSTLQRLHLRMSVAVLTLRLTSCQAEQSTTASLTLRIW